MSSSSQSDLSDNNFNDNIQHSYSSQRSNFNPFLDNDKQSLSVNDNSDNDSFDNNNSNDNNSNNDNDNDDDDDNDDSSSSDSYSSYFELAQQDLVKVDDDHQQFNILSAQQPLQPEKSHKDENINKYKDKSNEPDGFALIEDWDGSLVFGHIDEESQLQNLIESDNENSNSNNNNINNSKQNSDNEDSQSSSSSSPIQMSSSIKPKARPSTGDTTDEDLPALPDGFSALQATQITPSDTPRSTSPSSSNPLKEGRKPPMGHFINKYKPQLQRIPRPGVQPSKIKSAGTGQINANSIIIDGKHKPVPSPYRDFYIPTKQHPKQRSKLSKVTTTSSDESESSEEEDHQRSPQVEALSLDDLLDSSAFTSTSSNNNNNNYNENQGYQKYYSNVSRWDRVPIGAFRSTRSTADFESPRKVSLNPTNPHLLASAKTHSKSSKVIQNKHSSKSRSKSRMIPSPLLFPRDGAGQGVWHASNNNSSPNKDNNKKPKSKEENDINEIPNLKL